MSAGMVIVEGHHVSALVRDTLDGIGPLRLQQSIPLADLARTCVVPNARILLAALDGADAKLTAKGNMTRKLVTTLIEDFRWPGYDAATILSARNTLNEPDVLPVHYLHIILKLSGLVRHEKGLLKLTRKGKTMLAEERAGALQGLLFQTTYTRFNTAYLDRNSSKETFGWQISLVLYLIGRFADRWHPADTLMRSVTLPSPPEPPLPYSGLLDLRLLAFESRVLQYLCWFGLLEQKNPAANDDWQQPRLYQKTPLYDRFLQFVL